ncbi:MPHOSPH9 [Mytilus edulis]|uniref:MPHOSPH9 n=1 Tax=Mytilus edulis TaxID=6550 RepID=A0A8S3UEP3_MYTED|nr:MPHOSPH9 [Mytilus edulis]
MASRPSEQLYRINIYHTTCRLEINGRQAEQFIQELKSIGEQPNQNLQKLNEIIKSKCQEYLQQKIPAAAINQTHLRNKRTRLETEECSKDNARLKLYSLKLEAQVKELENSNRILRMKVTGNNPDRQLSSDTESKVPSQTINHSQQSHPVYHHPVCCHQQPSPQTAF